MKLTPRQVLGWKRDGADMADRGTGHRDRIDHPCSALLRLRRACLSGLPHIWGHRIYAPTDVERLYAVLVLRRLGMSTLAISDELAGPDWDLRSIAARQRAELDAQMTALGSLRHRVDGLVDGAPGDAAISPAALIREMQQLADAPFAVRHALALLP